MARMGSRKVSRYFVARVGPGFDSERVSLGLVVSRKVGNAVARNYVKRCVREWFRRNRSLLSEGTDLVVIARSGAATLDSAVISRELSTLVTS